MDSPSLRKHRKKWEKKSTLPTQALSCSGSKGLSQPDLLASLAKLPVQKQMQTPILTTSIIKRCLYLFDTAKLSTRQQLKMIDFKSPFLTSQYHTEPPRISNRFFKFTSSFTSARSYLHLLASRFLHQFHHIVPH